MPATTIGFATVARTVCSGLAVSDDTAVSSVSTSSVPDGTSISIIIGAAGAVAPGADAAEESA